MTSGLAFIIRQQEAGSVGGDKRCVTCEPRDCHVVLNCLTAVLQKKVVPPRGQRKQVLEDVFPHEGKESFVPSS